jgi:hypothetical protein
VENFRGPMEMLERDPLLSMFNRIGLSVDLKIFSQPNRVAGFDGLNLFFQLP